MTESARRIGMIVEYDGSGYHGWQRQTNARGVQQTLEEALENLTGESVRLSAAGRTDTGVHALGQVVSFTTRLTWDADAFTRALHYWLPDDVGVRAAWDAPLDFNPRRDAVLRHYRFRLWNRPIPPVLERHLWTATSHTLDFDRIREAGQRLIGDHDFRGFRSTKCSAKRTRLDLERLEWTEVEPDLWEMEISSRSFLRNMIRIIVGTLIEIGRGAEPVELIDQILESGDRLQAGPTAGPAGLILERVDYPEGRVPAVEE